MLRLALPSLLILGGLTSPARLNAADPLDCVPPSAQVVVVSDNPRKLAEAITTLDAFKEVQKLGPARQLYDSTNARRLLQMLGFAEKELGAKWPELLDQIGGNGVALAFQLSEGSPPALLVVEGKDEKQSEKAVALVVRVIEEELARQGAKEALKRTTIGSVEALMLGNDIHFARIGATVLVSNKAETLKAAIEQRTAERSKTQVHKARTDAAKILPKNPLAWLWVNFASVKQSKQAKDFFDSSRGQFLFTLVGGATIDCLRRADFIAAGLYKEPTGFRFALRIPAGRDGMWEELGMHVPPKSKPGSLPLLDPPGTIYSQSMYLDIGYMWKNREKLITGDDRRNFEMAEKQVSKILPGSVKLGEWLEMWGPYHRIVVVNHDKRPYKKEPALKLPAFGYVATMHDKKFGTTADIAFRSAGVIGSLQLGLKLTEYDIDGVTLVGYRFPENKELAEDPDGIRFNFEPCFAVVGDELVVASTVELGKKLIAELKKTTRGEASPALIRVKGSAREAADLLTGFSEPLITDAVLSRGIGLTEARQEVADIIAFVKTLGTAHAELDITDKEYRVDVVWESK